jgi:hypothetical protein
MLQSVSKMQLVPVDKLLQRVSFNEKSPAAIETANVQYKMEQVLQDSQLPADVKVKLVNNLLLKEQSLTGQVQQPPPVTIPNIPTVSSGDTSTAPSIVPSSLTPSTVVNFLPKTYRNRAERLLNYLQPHIQWSDKGELLDSDGVGVPGTNIVDLVRYSVNSAKSFAKGRQPSGWREFQSRLEASNVPNALAPGLFVNNDLRADYLRRKPSSPRDIPPSKQPRMSANPVRKTTGRIRRPVQRWEAY